MGCGAGRWRGASPRRQGQQLTHVGHLSGQYPSRKGVGYPKINSVAS